MGSESNPPAFAATLCGNGSLLIHTIESPALTVMTGGVKATASIVTVWVTGRGPAAAPGPLHDSSPGTASGEEQRASHDGARDYFDSDDWTILAWSRWATNAGRTFTSSAFSSAFDAFGISVLSTASSTCW